MNCSIEVVQLAGHWFEVRGRLLQTVFLAAPLPEGGLERLARDLGGGVPPTRHDGAGLDRVWFHVGRYDYTVIVRPDCLDTGKALVTLIPRHPAIDILPVRVGRESLDGTKLMIGLVGEFVFALIGQSLAEAA